MTGLDISKMAVLPFLMGNSECWVETPKKAINLLTSIQNDFLRMLFSTPTGTPTSILYWDTASLKTENYIIQQKLLFLHHLVHLPENTLANEIYRIQKENSLPGLVKECEDFLTKMNISEDPVYLTKYQWKKNYKIRCSGKK